MTTVVSCGVKLCTFITLHKHPQTSIVKHGQNTYQEWNWIKRKLGVNPPGAEKKFSNSARDQPTTLMSADHGNAERFTANRFFLCDILSNVQMICKYPALVQLIYHSSRPMLYYTVNPKHVSEGACLYNSLFILNISKGLWGSLKRYL